jgi:hypothetical protein
MSLTTKNHLAIVLDVVKKLINQFDKKLEDSIADWKQEDETKLDFIKNKPNAATNEEIITLLTNCELIKPITDANGNFFTNNSGKILIL